MSLKVRNTEIIYPYESNLLFETKIHIKYFTFLFLDIDECREFSGVCKGGRCSNTFGSFTCICPDGYKLDSTLRNCIGK